jgi:hypothetical protein
MVPWPHHTPKNFGIPIGNLTSQVFANFYMDSFDHFIKHDMGVKYYGRYVDDFVLFHQDMNYLKSIIPVISNFLLAKLDLSIHPGKIYLQHYSKGVKFIGAVIKLNRIYIASRTKGNFHDAIVRYSELSIDHKPADDEISSFLSSMNSYLGIMKHYQSYGLRRRIIL